MASGALKEDFVELMFTLNLLLEQHRSSGFAREWYFFYPALRHRRHFFGVHARHKSVSTFSFANVICQNPTLFQAYPAQFVKLKFHAPFLQRIGAWAAD